MSLFQLDDVFTYQDANEIKQLWASDTAPESPGDGEVWLDTTTNPAQLKRWNGSGWNNIGDSNYIKNNADDSFDGVLTSTITSGNVILFDEGDSRITVHDGSGNFNIKSGVDENHLITSSGGASHIELAESGAITLAVSTQATGETFTDDLSLYINSSGVVITGKTTFLDDLRIPTAQPTSPGDGSIWIA